MIVDGYDLARLLRFAIAFAQLQCLCTGIHLQPKRNGLLHSTLLFDASELGRAASLNCYPLPQPCSDSEHHFQLLPSGVEAICVLVGEKLEPTHHVHISRPSCSCLRHSSSSYVLTAYIICSKSAGPRDSSP